MLGTGRPGHAATAGAALTGAGPPAVEGGEE